MAKKAKKTTKAKKLAKAKAKAKAKKPAKKAAPKKAAAKKAAPKKAAAKKAAPKKAASPAKKVAKTAAAGAGLFATEKAKPLTSELLRSQDPRAAAAKTGDPLDESESLDELSEKEAKGDDWNSDEEDSWSMDEDEETVDNELSFDDED